MKEKYSRAKWNCLWTLLAWSSNMIIASQFILATEHKIFYFTSLLATVGLPILTARYANSSGYKASHLLSAFGVICDPVLCWISVTPSLLLRSFPGLCWQRDCLRLYEKTDETANRVDIQLGRVTNNWSQVLQCFHNRSTDVLLSVRWRSSYELEEHFSDQLKDERDMAVSILQFIVFMPILVALFMGRRNNRIHQKTHVVCMFYWLTASAECCSLLDHAYRTPVLRNSTTSTAALFAICSVVCNSLAVVSFARFISPLDPCEEDSDDDSDYDDSSISGKRNSRKRHTFGDMDSSDSSEYEQDTTFTEVVTSELTCTESKAEMAEEREDEIEVIPGKDSREVVKKSDVCDITFRISNYIPIAAFVELPMIVSKLQIYNSGETLLTSFFIYWVKNVFIFATLFIIMVKYAFTYKDKLSFSRKWKPMK